MKQWLLANGISILTLLTFSFSAGVVYGTVSETKVEVKETRSIVDEHTKALIEVVTELRIMREKGH